MENFIKKLFVESKGGIIKYGRQSFVKKNFFTNMRENKALSLLNNTNISNRMSLNKPQGMINYSSRNFSSVIKKQREQAPADPFLKSITAEATSEIQKIYSKLEGRQKIPFELLNNLMNKLERLDSATRENAESLLLEVIRKDKFYQDYLNHPDVEMAHKNYSDLFYNARKLRNISDEDISRIQKFYFDLDKIPREFTIQERTRIFDAFYYYKRDLSKERFNLVGKMHGHVVKSYLEFFTSFTHSEIGPIIQNIMFLSDDEVRVFALRMVDKMNYIINQEFAEKMKMSLQKKLDLLLFYPRILYTIRDTHPEIFEREKNRIEAFLLENKKQLENEAVPEVVLFTLSNYLVWTENCPILFEEYIPFLYRNLASFKPELTLELFFLLLNNDISKMKNPNKAVSLINLIYQTIKNCPTTRIFTFEYLKEAFYFNEIRNNLDDGYESWDSKDLAEGLDHPDHYHKKILRSLVKKSSDLYPFAAMHYDDKLFDTIFANLKKYLQF
jgi:hypothetical protein